MPLLLQHIEINQISSKYAIIFIYKVQAAVFCRNKIDI